MGSRGGPGRGYPREAGEASCPSGFEGQLKLRLPRSLCGEAGPRPGGSGRGALCHFRYSITILAGFFKCNLIVFSLSLCRPSKNLMFLTKFCGRYLTLYLTKRPVLAEHTGSRVVWEPVCLRSEGQISPPRPRPRPAKFTFQVMSDGGFPARWVHEGGRCGAALAKHPCSVFFLEQGCLRSGGAMSTGGPALAKCNRSHGLRERLRLRSGGFRCDAFASGGVPSGSRPRPPRRDPGRPVPRLPSRSIPAPVYFGSWDVYEAGEARCPSVFEGHLVCEAGG
jgi:hypothetical protein